MPRLVLSDDNLTTQRMVELSLEAEGYEVVAFADGKDALDYVLHNEVDVILANVSSPGLDGYSLCSELAQEPDKVGIPVILVVGALDAVEEKRARESGCSELLSKPFSTGGLLEVVTRAREQASEEPATVSNLFEVPIQPGAQEPLFELSRQQALCSDKTLSHVHLSPSVRDLAAAEVAQRMDEMAAEFSRRLPEELSRLMPELTDRLCTEMRRP